MQEPRLTRRMRLSRFLGLAVLVRRAYDLIAMCNSVLARNRAAKVYDLVRCKNGISGESNPAPCLKVL